MSNASYAPTSTPPKKKRKWLRRLIVISLIVLLLVLPVSCAVYLTLKPYNAINLNHSIGFRTGVETGPGADSSWSEEPKEFYDTPEESLKANGWLDDCEFMSEPLAVNETDESIAIVYFYDFGPENGNKMNFNVVRLEKQNGRYSAPPRIWRLRLRRYRHGQRRQVSLRNR